MRKFYQKQSRRLPSLEANNAIKLRNKNPRIDFQGIYSFQTEKFTLLAIFKKSPKLQKERAPQGSN